MKSLLVADIHFDLHKFDWVVDAAEHVDVVVLAGDHLDASSNVDRKAQAVVVDKYFRRIRERCQLLVSSGNHDLDWCDARGELTTRWIAKTRYYGVPTDGDSHRIDTTLFTICPWAAGRGARADIARRLAHDAEDRPAQWVWIHHAPPEGSPVSWDGKKSFGDQDLSRWIKKHQPDLVFCGHVHQSPFTGEGSWADRIGRTWVFNPGYQMGPLPTHIVIDSATPGAHWISLGGVETTPLDGPPARPFAQLADAPEWLEAMVRSVSRSSGETPHPARA